jgi:hypothetical protein
MPISMYHASVPVFLQLLGGLKGVVEKAEAHATAHKWEENTILNWRFYPDMFTFARQVRQASEHAFGAGRAAGVEVPKLPAIDNRFAEMKARIDKTIDFLKGLKADQLDGRRTRRSRSRRRPTAQFPRPSLSLSPRNAELLFPYDDRTTFSAASGSRSAGATCGQVVIA